MKNPTVSIDPAARTVMLRFVGIVNLDTLLTGRETLQREPGWSPHYAHIFDLTRVSDLALTAKEIAVLASAPPVFDKRAPQVLVARDGSFEFTLARTFGVYAKDRRSVHVVTSVESARALVATLKW